MAETLKLKKCSLCKEEIEYPWGKKPEKCPACGVLFWDKPEDERILFLLQKTYLDSGRDSKYLDPIYRHLIFYAGNMIKHILRNKHILSEEEFEEKSIDIATKIIERYLKDPTMKVNVSFGGLLNPVTKGVLFGKRKDDDHDSLNVTIMESSKELEENLSYVGFERIFPVEKNFQETSENEISKLIDKIYTIVDKIHSRIHVSEKSKSVSLLYLVAVKNRLYMNSNRFMEKFYEMSGNVIKDDIRKTELVLKNFLKEDLYV